MSDARWQPPTASEVDSSLALYRIVYQRAESGLSDQRSAIDAIRTRSLQVAAISVAATATLVAASVKSAHRDGTFYGLTISAIFTDVLLLVITALILTPQVTLSFISADRILERWIETEAPPPTEAALLRELTLALSDAATANAFVIYRLQRILSAGVAAGVASVLLWITVVWTRA